MILSGPEILARRDTGDVHIEPFNPIHIGPNSYDLRLGENLKTYSKPCRSTGTHLIIDGRYPLWVPQELDTKKEPKTYNHLILNSGFWLKPGILYLGHTLEEAGSDTYVPMIEGRSSLARLGLKVHVTAGFGDIGFQSQWTLELEVTHPLRVYPGMRVCQVYFHTLKGEVQLYDGKYSNSQGAEVSQAWRDFE